MICIRRARPADATAIGLVHVATWRSAYAGVLPEDYLTGLSALRHAAGYEQAITERQNGHAVFVAVASGADAPEGMPADQSVIIGFVSGGRARRPGLSQGLGQGLGQGEMEGEVETLYLLEDYRDRGVGRRLMRAMAAHLAAVGCRSVMLWVLRDNPTRWFYKRLGGRPAAQEIIRFAGQALEQLAFVWDPIESLLTATARAPEG